MEIKTASLERYALCSRIGTGPWQNSSYDMGSDFALLKRQRFNRNIHVQHPTEGNKKNLYQNFVYIPNVVSYFYGQVYKYDIFTTIDDISEGLKKSEDKNEIVSILRSKNIIERTKITVDDPFCLTKSLSRIRQTSLASGNESTLEALTTLHNVAKLGQKIAVFNAHGRVYKEDGELILMVNATNDKEVAANTLINQLTTEKGTEYGAIYFMSCNSYSEGEHSQGQRFAEISTTTLPVVIHTTEHDDTKALNPAKVYWPQN